ncbi:ATP-dependent helicase HrpB [Trichlorobacter thiogenes]|uniref:ATP-dependent helicase HrpB n=1 Tax=Trichlorobacter thiogenes TaxID=115783 RepID=A0A1T4RQU7_9BACT|nr:ATP-dependent helicase HrpB [Trichlorobacter thiogenes]SKA18196.1 ATP-dependent helicase HrpB [Trichlorobacter thiogenes]
MIDLPITQILPELLATLQTTTNVVLSAAPGAGKTTRVPLELLTIIPAEAGRIIMLEPRRIAAASAARYMAQSLGEQVGQTVGYTIRFESKVSNATRIEVVTEGVLTRRIQNDPELFGVACVIFDEFHERSIQADLGLALCLETQAALRPDLKLLVMSATLDCGPIARLLGDAPVVVSQGQAFPVQVIYPAVSDTQSLTRQMAAIIKTALTEEAGDLLAFLPGTGEIRAVERELAGLSSAVVCPLYGDLPFEKQQQAILPGPQRRVVLATNIAETSLTIEGVRIVVDSGLTRRLQLDPATGLERLVTVRAAKASADQRTGRAGRTAPGVCYRLYSQQTYQAMTPFTPPELMTADLAPLLLELAAWGVTDPASLAWLDQPPAVHLATAQELLQMLGALDAQGTITALGRRMVQLPLHPRLARLLLSAQEQGQAVTGCYLAAQLSNRSTAFRAIEQTAQQLLRLVGEKPQKCPAVDLDMLHNTPEMAVAAWPDRIAMLRQGGEGKYLLASGRGAVLSAKAGCTGAAFLVALQVDGGEGADGLIHQAVGLTEEQLRQAAGHLITKQRQVTWDGAAGRVAAAEQERICAVVLASRQIQADDSEAIPLLLEQVKRNGIGCLGWNDQSRQLQARVGLAARLLSEDGWPDISDAALLNTVEIWLGPHLSGIRSQQGVQQLSVLHLLQEVVGWNLLQSLDTVAPTYLTIPSGRKVALDYTDQEGPVLSVKLQELFGLATSPTVCKGRRAVLVHLLSPAGRPVAVTRDLKGFWERSYLEVRKELRGRYPKHPWPDDPWNAVATHKTKKAFERS